MSSSNHGRWRVCVYVCFLRRHNWQRFDFKNPACEAILFSEALVGSQMLVELRELSGSPSIYMQCFSLPCHGPAVSKVVRREELQAQVAVSFRKTGQRKHQALFSWTCSLLPTVPPQGPLWASTVASGQMSRLSEEPWMVREATIPPLCPSANWSPFLTIR